MNIRERLKEAYENVSFNADRSWTNDPNAYHKTNMELYLRERHIQRKIMNRKRPRTVRDCIPTSKLATYSDYCYDESREMSYASCPLDSKLTADESSSTEPWELSEVGELYKWFIKYNSDDDKKWAKFDRTYESPLLNVSGFQDKILKIQIREERVKNIWKKLDHRTDVPNRSTQMKVNLFASPIKNVFLFNAVTDYNHDWFKNISISKDFEQLEQLSKSLIEQTNSISKFSGSSETITSSTEQYSTEILYSEVLQGLSPSRKFVKAEAKPSNDESSAKQNNFTNYTVLNSHRTEQKDANQSNIPQVASLQNNKFLAQKSSLPNIHLQTDGQSYAKYKHPCTQFPCPLRASVANQPFSSSYVQQTYFYSPMQPIPRWVHPTFNTSYPTQVLASSWMPQNPMLSNGARMFGPTLVNPVGDNRESIDALNRRFVNCCRVESSQFKSEASGEAETPSEPPQVSASVSEDLETQALEQYSSSNDNFYQELERQATEQYTSSPE